MKRQKRAPFSSDRITGGNRAIGDGRTTAGSRRPASRPTDRPATERQTRPRPSAYGTASSSTGRRPSSPAGKAAAAAGAPNRHPDSRKRQAVLARLNKPRPDPLTDMERYQRIERRKARSRAIGVSIFVMLTMLLTVLMIITVMNRTKPKPRFTFIQAGILSHTVQSKGLIMRDEAVFNAPAAGILKPLVTEGSRAAKDQKIALIIPEDQEEQIEALQKCENDITELQIELMNTGKGSGALAIYDESAASLDSVINLIRGDTNREQLANLSAYATSLSVIMDQRSTKLLKIDFNDARLDELRATRSQLENTLGLDSGTLICEQPGILSYKLDGLEGVLNEAATATITLDQYRQYVAAVKETSAASTAVTTDQPVLRITGSLFQYLVFFLADANPAVLPVDTFVDLNIPADGTVIRNCRVIRSEATENGAFLVFKTDREVEWFADRRTLTAELTLSSTTGLKVPMVSLIDYDEAAGQAGLLIVSGGKTRLAKVKVVDHDREYAIIEAIEGEPVQPVVSTILVINPDSIAADEFIDQ